MCEKAVLRFCISLIETFSKSVFVKLINKYDKGAVIQISKVVGPVYHVTCPGASEMGLFRHHHFRRPKFKKNIKYKGHPFFEHVQNLM